MDSPQLHRPLKGLLHGCGTRWKHAERGREEEVDENLFLSWTGSGHPKLNGGLHQNYACVCLDSSTNAKRGRQRAGAHTGGPSHHPSLRSQYDQKSRAAKELLGSANGLPGIWIKWM